LADYDDPPAVCPVRLRIVHGDPPIRPRGARRQQK
jgi:hypothetical protein